MAKDKTQYTCTDCGGISAKWLGKCPSCGAWNTLIESAVETAGAAKNRYAGMAALAPASEVAVLSDIEAQDVARTPTGQEELDRVLGGGMVEGGVVLIGGDPGIGKSTLLLQAMDGLQRSGMSTLYVTGEESGAQVALRSRRLGLDHSQVQVLAETQLEKSWPPSTNCNRGWWSWTPSKPCIPINSPVHRARWRRCVNARRISRAWPSPPAPRWCWWGM